MCKAVDRRMWSFEQKLAQFSLTHDVIEKLGRHAADFSIEEMRDLDAVDLGQMIHLAKMGSVVKRCVMQFPQVILEAVVAPITKTVLRISLEVTSGIKI